MEQNYLVMLNCKPIKKGKKFFANEAAELKFEQQMFSKYAKSECDFVEVIYL